LLRLEAVGIDIQGYGDRKNGFRIDIIRYAHFLDQAWSSNDWESHVGTRLARNAASIAHEFYPNPNVNSFVNGIADAIGRAALSAVPE
tara:strand:+ start:9022 stop:9285 length:264 start_codon:yes stop_codon:yes gene_type:complete